MAIRMMISKERAEEVGYVSVEVVTNYSGHETNRVYHCSGCPHGKSFDHSFSKGESCCTKDTHCESQWCHGCNNFDPLYMETSHIGVVLETGEENGYNDSDFYAIVWNDEKGCTERVTYASTRGWTYPNGASVDATPEVVAKWEKWSADRQEARRVAQVEKEAATPSHGKTVQVVKGRKIPIGTKGEVCWAGKCQYSGNLRVGIRLTSGEKVFTAGSNVVVIL